MMSTIERLRNLFLLAFFLLVISIIFTPLLLRSGFLVFSEEVLESIILLLQISVAWKIFRLYEKAVHHREKEIQTLEREYQKREKELLEAFAYLGKVNVQVSLIKSFLQKLKAPSSRKEAENYTEEILKIALTLGGKKWATLRAMNTESFQTLKEYWAYAAGTDQNAEASGIKLGNKDIVKWEKNRDLGKKNGFYVFGSAGSDLTSYKVYLIFPNRSDLEPDIEDFLRAAANQCEVLLTLFDLKEKK